MKRLITIVVGGLAIVAAGSSAALGACADLNNDGQVNSTDVAILGSCAASFPTSCPTLPAPGLCGVGNAAACGDVLEDGTIDFSDVDALRTKVTGGDPLFDLCEGPGPDIACGGGTVTLGSPTPLAITSSQTWPASCKVVIGGLVTIETPPGSPTTVISIEAGSVVKGATGTTVANPAALVFQPGTHIDAIGTPTTPIIFTSTAAPGTRSKGDWGGVVFNGRGTVNGPGCTFTSEGLPFSFGGCESDYNGGRAVYVRTEMAGLDFTANNELNLWTMNGLGTQTLMNFLMVVNGEDDGFEWFGGTSNHNHLVAAAAGDDGVDWQLGYTGALQNVIYLQSGTQTDTGGDSRGIEADNSEFDGLATPFSAPDICNMTLVGGENQPGANDGSDSGIFLRRGTRAQIANALVTAFADACVELRETDTTTGACVDADSNGVPEALTGDTILRSSILADCGSGSTEIAKNGAELDADDVSQTDLGPCDQVARPGCACDTETWYNLLVTGGFNVPNASGFAAAVDFDNADGDLDKYPPLDAAANAACTGLETPLSCCSGVGTGSCRELWDPRHVITVGVPPAPASCSAINPILNNTGYLGGVNPAAACTTSGVGASCDWLVRPWAEFNIN
jgi:hypothetical protein